jgi:hypothetical protein
MNYSKSIAVFLVAGAVCVAAPDAVNAQARSRGGGGRPGGGHAGAVSVGRAVPRGPSHVYGPGRYYAPAHRGYYGPYHGPYYGRVVGYAPYYPYYYPYRAGLTVGFYAGVGFPYGYASFGYPYPYYGYRGYYGYPGYGYPGYGPYGYPLPPAGYVSMAPGHAYGGVRIQGAPLDAQVFADGYYVGIVDDFDGTYQHVNLEAGRHQIEIRLPGGNSEPMRIDVNVLAGQTITYHAGITQ